MKEIKLGIFTLNSPEKTEAVAAKFAERATAGSVFLLEGQIGAGKSHFSRAFIRHRLARANAPIEDIPSPTFTIVQTYFADCEIWHADLYRLSDPDEIEELGLIDAFRDSICLIEWPDRLGSELPETYLRLCLEPGADENTRQLSLFAPANQTDHWQEYLRELQ